MLANRLSFVTSRLSFARSSRLSFARNSLLLPALGVAGAVFYAVLGSPTERTLVFLFVLALALRATFRGRRQARLVDHSVWLAAGLALCLFSAGEVAWLLWPKAQLGPFASVADALFLAACLALLVAAIAVAAARHAASDRPAWIEAAILSIVGGVAVWDLLIASPLADPRLTAGAKLVAVVHPLVDVAVLGVVLGTLLSRNGRDRSAVAFAAGASLLALTDLALMRAGQDRSFRTPAGYGALFLAGYALIGLAALAPAGAGTITIRSRARFGHVRVAVILAALFVPQLLLVRDLAGRQLIHLNTLTIAAAASVVVLALAAVRLRHLFSAARRAEAHKGEELLAALILHSADAIFLINRENRITFASPSAEELAGKPAGELLGTSVLDRFREEEKEAVGRQLANLTALPVGATVPLEGRVHDAAGQARVVEGLARNLLADENVGAIVVTLRDTTTRRELEQQLERRAFHDDLTGLANRALFADRMSHALKRKQRDLQTSLAVLFIDLDDFKAVNDGMGHDAGDELIRAAGERIRANVRPGDTVARLGGDEFAVLVEDIVASDDVLRLAERVIEVLALPIDVKGVGMAVSASVGVTYATHESSVESLLRDADIAMYSAKSQGKGRVEVFDTALRDEAVRRLALRLELPAALRESQFRVVYQPITRVSDERLTGFEALIRWHHPKHGLISPAEFIPAAEETGMIVDLGRWILGQACIQTADWNRRRPDPLSISVNVSGLQLHQPGFADEVRRTLENTGLGAAYLTLELTESILVKHQRVEAILMELRALGIGIAIDDFGTGYSSLSYLQQFPATSIKIDRTFVSSLDAAGDSGLARSILAIGKALNLTTVAEGVETAEQLAALRELGCDRAQGFLFGRPQTAGEIEGMLETRRMVQSAEFRRTGVPVLEAS